MCGIAGVWAPGRPKAQLSNEVGASIRVLKHRGPDDSGVWVNGSGVGLGHARLSILDLSVLGHQPMASHDGRFQITYNGEIYNFQSIRYELEQLGHHFVGTGDTEMILAAFTQWGHAAVDRFVGMFALALWDEREQELSLYRDRIGIKPLYYAEFGDSLVFASELKGLRAFEGFRNEIDRAALGEFFQYGYIAGDRSIYKGVHKLKPGHRLIRRVGRPHQIAPYWSILPALQAPLHESEADSSARLEELLNEAFEYRMVSDVPVGVYLSGGIDSSLVTALLARKHGSALRTFTIGFAEDSHDESVWARKVAEHCGTTHTEYKLGISEGLAIARGWGKLFDEPFGDTSGIPTLLVSRLASQSVKVVLSADGGDELFSGYEVYASALGRAQALRWAKGPQGRLASACLARVLPERLGPRGGGRWHKLHRWSQTVAQPEVADILEVYVSYYRPGEVRTLLGTTGAVRANAGSYPGGAVDQLSLWDFFHYLPEDILTKVDRTTMAVSIEGREPLLDHRIAELAFRLPLRMKRGELGSKHALKQILHRHVPRQLVERPKQGFAIPLEHWLRHELKELVDEYLAPERIRSGGILDPRLVRQVQQSFHAGNGDLATPLWFLLAFEMWREEWGGS